MIESGDKVRFTTTGDGAGFPPMGQDATAQVDAKTGAVDIHIGYAGGSVIHRNVPEAKAPTPGHWHRGPWTGRPISWTDSDEFRERCKSFPELRSVAGRRMGVGA